MKTIELFKKKRVFSFEVFPPKRTSPIESIFPTIEALSALKPDFISVTYGAGGSSNSATTIEIASKIKHDYKIESVAHLPCVNLTRADVLEMLAQLKEHEIENILALRGDISPDFPPKNEFKHASDLVKFIRENGDFDVMGACYPETHFEAINPTQDLANLKTKVDSGVSHLISQLFFDNKYFYEFIARARASGITVPIEAGIMPVTNRRQIERMVTLCGASLPDKFLKMMDRFESKPEAMRDAGIAYAVNQIVDLAAHGVDGIHIYTMNSPLIARRICEATANIINA